MDKQLKNILIGTGFGVCLFVALMHLDVLAAQLAKAAGLLRPVLVGGVLAFVLNVPMAKLEAWLDSIVQKSKSKRKPPSCRAAALLLTVLAVVLLLVLLCAVVIPQMVGSITEAVRQLNAIKPQAEMLLQRFGVDSAWLQSFDTDFLSGDWLQKLTSGVNLVGSAVLGTVTSVAGQLAGFAMAVVFMFYFLLGKEMLARQCTWVLRRVLPGGMVQKLLFVARRLQQTYASFFSGQCVEAAILGLLMFAAFSVFRLPYAGLVAVLTAFTSFIPYIGSFLSCAVGVVLILLVNPWQALLAFVVYQVVQFCENQFIYPRVVGSAVGLPPLYTILAVFLGGTLFGVVGMIFFIPLMATAYSLLKTAESAQPQTTPAAKL